MSQRFNAPPGWQVPEGFVPPTGWQPDPSWPPAPAGWNFWVDDAAPGAAPAGASATGAPGAPAPGYGPAAPDGYGASHVPGSANAALAQTQMKAHKRTMLIGFGILAGAILVTLVSFGIAAASPTGGTVFFPWYIGLIGLIFGIRGAVALSKAKKALGETAVGGMAGAYGNGPANSAPMPPPAGPGPQQPAPGPQQPAPGPQQPGNTQGDDGGQRSLGDLYR